METVLNLEQKSNLSESYRRQHNCQQKKDNAIYKTLHRQLKIEQHETH
jgi:hypothetical protein